MMTDGAAEFRLDLDTDSALVLFEMLARRTEAGGVVHDLHPAEAAMLNTIEAQLEAQLTAPFAPDYAALLDAARARPTVE